MNKLIIPYLYTDTFINKFDEAENTFNNLKQKLNATTYELYEMLSYRYVTW